jgi:EAL domain-containing protein (putative c-di-GMP-specific phosphodiesterase class I)
VTRSEHGAVSAAELRQAWERWELLLHCQPQVDLRAGSIAGVEELLGFLGRWRNPIMNANDTPTISCCECCKEISLDAALTP